MIKSVTGPSDRGGQRRPGELGHRLPLRRHSDSRNSEPSPEFSGPAESWSCGSVQRRLEARGSDSLSHGARLSLAPLLARFKLEPGPWCVHTVTATFKQLEVLDHVQGVRVNVTASGPA